MPYTYQQDCALIDKLLIINAGLSGDPQLIKEAGIVDSLGGIATKLTNEIKERVQEEGIMGTLVSYLALPTLMAVCKPIGILFWLLQLFSDTTMGGVLNKAQSLLKNTLDQNGTVTKEDATRISNEATQGLNTTASLDLLRQLEKQGQLSKFAWPGRSRYRSSSGILDKANPLSAIKGKRGTFGIMLGILKWFIITVIMGFVGVEGTQWAKEKFTGKNQPAESETESDEMVPQIIGVPQALTNALYTKPQTSQQASVPTVTFPQTTHDLAPSGQGESYFINSNANQWWANIPNGNVTKALLYWAKTIYPELAGKEADIINTKSFINTASTIKANYKPETKDWIRIPPSNVHSWRNIVDSFAGDIKHE
jgi:hypothetical protein